MRAEDRVIARKQLDKRLELARHLEVFARPHRGWIKAIREALGLTTKQLGKRMGVSQPRIVDIEKSENMGSITLGTLERAANAMDCKLVYTLVPRRPLTELVEERARILAKKKLAVTGHNMALEAQSVLDEDEQVQFELMVRKILEKAGSNIWKEDE
ncbi:MAG: mobile mystery protein A [Oleiphilus sp.]|nr:MAG: mobile mystery protein A [Oleiphilus sp.]